MIKKRFQKNRMRRKPINFSKMQFYLKKKKQQKNKRYPMWKHTRKRMYRNSPIVVTTVIQKTTLFINVHAFNPLYVVRPASCAMCSSSSNPRNLPRANDFQSSSLIVQTKQFKIVKFNSFLIIFERSVQNWNSTLNLGSMSTNDRQNHV